MMEDEVAEDDFDDGMPSWEDVVPAAEEISQSNASSEIHLSTGSIYQIATDPVCPKDHVIVQVSLHPNNNLLLTLQRTTLSAGYSGEADGHWSISHADI